MLCQIYFFPINFYGFASIQKVQQTKKSYLRTWKENLRKKTTEMYKSLLQKPYSNGFFSTKMSSLLIASCHHFHRSFRQHSSWAVQNHQTMTLACRPYRACPPSATVHFACPKRHFFRSYQNVFLEIFI